MASALPKQDESTAHEWQCLTCRYRHKPGSACPRAGRWLVTGGPVIPPQPVRALTVVTT